MKRYLNILFIGCLVGICCAEETSTKTPGNIIQEAIKPITTAGQETKTLKVFLDSSINSYNTTAKSLKEKEESFKSAYANAKDKSEKTELLSNYLNNKQDLIGKMIEDFSFVNDKLAGKVTTLNSVIGDVGQKATLVQKAEKAAADTSATSKTIQQLQLDWRDIKAESPKPGTKEYIPWFQKSRETKRQFISAVGQLKRSIRQEIIYNWLSSKMKMGEENIVRWQEYVATLTLIFEQQREELRTEKEITSDVLAAVEAGKIFSEVEDFTKYANQVNDIVKGITGTPMPPMPDIGGDGPDEAALNKLIEGSEFDIDTFDPIQFKNDLKKKIVEDGKVE